MGESRVELEKKLRMAWAMSVISMTMSVALIGVIQDGVVLNFRALAHTGYIDIYEKVAINEALHKLTGQEHESARDWAKWYRESTAKQ